MTAWESTTTEDVASSNIKRQNGYDHLMNISVRDKGGCGMRGSYM